MSQNSSHSLTVSLWRTFGYEDCDTPDETKLFIYQKFISKLYAQAKFSAIQKPPENATQLKARDDSSKMTAKLLPKN